MWILPQVANCLEFYFLLLIDSTTICHDQWKAAPTTRQEPGELALIPVLTASAPRIRALTKKSHFAIDPLRAHIRD